MAEQILADRRILIVEDEYLLADDLSEALRDGGATVLGPVASIAAAAELIAAEARIDAAVLDINLRGEMVFPIADSLMERGVPFVFATGYDAWAVPERFAAAPRVEKPLKGRAVAATLVPLLASTRSTTA